MASTLEVYKNNDKTYNLTFENSAGTAIDLTDCYIHFTIKEMELKTEVLDANAILHKVIDPADHTDPTNGKSVLVLTNTDLDIDEGTYYFDFQLINMDGKITTLQKGVFKVLERVTLTV